MPASDRQLRGEAAVRQAMLGGGVRAASRQWAVDRSYINRRLQDVPTREETNRARQLLSPHLEGQLASWAIGQARLGYAPALFKFRLYAQNLLNAGGGAHRLGKAWHTRFLARNPEIKAARSKIIDYQRVNGATVANINIFFDRLEAPDIAAIPLDRYYNSDEMGIGQGVGGDHFVICEATSRKALKKDIEKGEWITALECVSAGGLVLPPLMIFKGIDVQAQWFPDQDNAKYDTWRFEASPNGWTSNFIALKWLEDLFLPHIRHHHGNKWVVLVCDGHESHVNDDFLWLCIANKVWLCFYEPHCSHVVQALDVGAFGLVKKRLRHHLRDCASGRLGIKPSKLEVIEALYQARLEALTPAAIKKAWATTGIWPRDRSKPLSSRFVVLEEEGVARPRAEAPIPVQRPKTPDFAAIVTPGIFSTPTSGQAILRTSRKMAFQGVAVRSGPYRRFSLKAAKALDGALAEIAQLKASNASLRAKISKVSKKTRKAVKINPNQLFVRMADIRRAKRRLRGRTIYDDEASDYDMPERPRNAVGEAENDVTEAEECIQVGKRRR